MLKKHLRHVCKVIIWHIFAFYEHFILENLKCQKDSQKTADKLFARNWLFYGDFGKVGFNVCNAEFNLKI